MTHKKNVPTIDLDALFDGAVSSGLVSQDVMTTLSGDLGSFVVAGAAGRALEDLDAAEVTLVTLMVDVSSSIFGNQLADAVCEAQNLLLDNLQTSPQADELMLALWLFDDQQRVVHAYVPVEDATRLDGNNYLGGGATSLYDTWIDGLMANVAYAQQLRDGGTPCRSLAVVITDGEDTTSRRSAVDCARLSRDVLASERFTLGFVGVGAVVDFRSVASAMGLPDDCVAVDIDPSPESLKRLLRQVSMAAIELSVGSLSTARGFF